MKNEIKCFFCEATPEDKQIDYYECCAVLACSLDHDEWHDQHSYEMEAVIFNDPDLFDELDDLI